MVVYRFVIAFVLFCATTARGDLRVGTVRIDALFLNDPEKIAYSEKAQAQMNSIKNDDRRRSLEEKQQALLLVNDEFKKLILSLDDLPNETQKVDAKKKIQELAVERQNKIVAFQSAQQEFDEYQSKESQLLNQEMAVKMRGILNRISAHVEKVAKDKDLDFVFEVSGYTNTGISVFPYFNKQAVMDITEDVLNEIKKK